MLNSSRRLLCFFTVFFLATAAYFAQSVFADNDQPIATCFTGAGDGTSWDDPLNWTQFAVPNSENFVGLELPLSSININSPSACEVLGVVVGESVNINAPLNVGQSSSCLIGAPGIFICETTLNINAHTTISPGETGAQFSAGSGSITNLNSGTLSTPMLSIGESISSNAQLNQNGGNLHVSENAQIQGSAALLIGPNDEFTGADLAVSGNGASITVTTPITSRNLFVGGFGNFTYQQPKDETSGVSVDGNLWVSVTLGTPTLQFEFDDNANTGLHWGIRVFGNQQTEMQDYLDDGLIVTSGTSEQVQVIYDPTPYGEYTYLGFLVGDSILLGDVNCDGFVNLLDIQPFVNLLSSGGFVEKADINQDGLVNLLDVQPFVDVLAGN